METTIPKIQNSTLPSPKKHKKKRDGFLNDIKRNKVLYAMLALPLIYVIIQYYLPMLGLVVAFKNFNYVDGLFKSPWCGLDNFAYLFQSADAFIITRNTILYNLVFIFLGLLVGVGFALILNELTNKRGAKFYQSAMFLPYFLSWVVVAYFVYALLEPSYGLLNRVMTSLHVVAPDWYQTASYWPAILVIVNIWKGAGYGTVIYLAGITGIDDTYYEAAMLDGCSKWNQARYITLPFLKPTMIVLTIMALGNIFRSDFGLFFQVPMDSGMVYDTTQTIDTYIYRALTGSGTVGMASAGGFYQSCVGFIVVMFANWTIGKVSPDDKIF